MKFYKYLFLFLCFLSISEVQGQNGWTRKAKGFYAQATATNFSSKNYYSTTGDLFNAGSTFNSSGLLIYGEYGLTDRITAILDLPLILLNRFSTTETVTGLGNAKLGLKYRLFKKLPISFQANFDIPTSDGIKFANAKTANEIGIIEKINLPTSDGEFNIWTTLVASQSTSNGKTFGSVYGSVNFRTKSFSNQLQIGLEIGHLFFDKLFLIGKLKIQEKLSSGTKQTNTSASFLYGEGTSYTSFGLTSIYKLKNNWNIITSYSDFSGSIVKRKNIYDGAAFSIGLALEY